MIFSLFGFLSISFSEKGVSGFHNDPVPELAVWYRNRVEDLMAEAKVMRLVAGNPFQFKEAKNQFKKMRLAYKRIAFLTDHFNPYQTLQLNSPAIARAEEDNPDQIIPPQGFQRLEELIWNAGDTAEIRLQTDFICNEIEGLLNEPDYAFKFRPDAVWQAIKEAIITVMTKGIAGLDAPVSGMGLMESSAMLDGICGMLEEWQTIMQKADAERVEVLRLEMQRASAELRTAKSFETFDRYIFLKKNMNPLYRVCVDSIAAIRKSPAEGLYAIHPEAKSLFESNALNIAFFSPNMRYLPTDERIALGRKLFFDPALSSTGKRSCATCHQPNYAFADTLIKALAIDEKTPLLRNTPTLLNVAYQTRQFYDSRMATLEFQVNSVVHNQLEMGGSIEETVGRLKEDAALGMLFRRAYPEENESVNKFTVANALGSFMRSLKSLNAPFDRAMLGMSELSKSEQSGFNLFMGKAKCGTCHFMPVFNGLVPPRYSETESEVLGLPATNKKRAHADADSGKYLFTKSQVHLFAFKTPTLRNVALTAPYMHNGVFTSLDEVIDFYDKGGGSGMGIHLPNQTLPPEKLGLTKQEKRDIISFLQTLTDTTVIRSIIM